MKHMHLVFFGISILGLSGCGIVKRVIPGRPSSPKIILTEDKAAQENSNTALAYSGESAEP